MEYKQIQELIKSINKSNISELSIKDGEFEITIKQQAPMSETQLVAFHQPMQLPQQQMMPSAQTTQALPAAQSTAPAASSADAMPAANTVTIKSPMIGTFYRSSSPDKPSFTNLGDEVKQGQVICIIEAMKLFNEIESEISGRIVKVLVEDASPVEYDQPLFLVEQA